MGIDHEDLLLRYLGYDDPQRVVDEAENCIRASELPEDKLRQFATRYFK